MSKYKNYAKSYSRMALNKKNTYASNCGAGKEGNAGFQSGNTCGGEGKGGGSEEPKKPKKPKKSDTGAGEGGGIWWGGNYAELNIPQEAVDDIAQSGANDEAVASWHGDIDFSNISDEQLKNELEQHDLGEANMKDRESQEKALLWMSAHDIKEDPDSYAPDTGAGEGGGDAPDTGSGGEKPWGSDSDMRVWIGDLGAYNSGELKGEWVNASDVQEAWEYLRENEGYGEEYYIGDVEGVPRDLAGQYGDGDLDEIANYANTMESHDNPEAFQAYIDATGASMGDAVDQFEDAYAGEAGRMSKRGQYDLPMGFVEDYVDSTGGAGEFLKNSQSPDSYIDREKFARDLSYDFSPDVMTREEYAELEGDDPDDLDNDFYVVDGNTNELMFGTDDESTTDREVDEYMEELADELIDSGSMSNPDFYFDYEQLAYDMVVGGDIMVSDGYVFWNM